MKWYDRKISGVTVAQNASASFTGTYPIFHGLLFNFKVASVNTLANLAAQFLTVKVGSRTICPTVPLHLLQRFQTLKGGNPGLTSELCLFVDFGCHLNVDLSVTYLNTAALSAVVNCSVVNGDVVDAPAFAYDARVAATQGKVDATDFALVYLAAMDATPVEIGLGNGVSQNLQAAHMMANAVSNMDSVNGTYTGFSTLDGVLYAGSPRSISYDVKLNGGSAPDILFRCVGVSAVAVQSAVNPLNAAGQAY